MKAKPYITICALVLLLAGCKQDTLDAEHRAAYREYLYVSNSGTNDVTVIDTLRFKAIGTIPVGKNPTGLAANPKRNEIYVVNTDANSLSVIDAEKNAVVATIGVHRSPFHVSVTPDGTRLFVTNTGSANVSVIDVAGRKVVATIPVGAAPAVTVVSPDGKTAVTSVRGENLVVVTDLPSLSTRARITVCTAPGEVVILPDSSKAYVACSADSKVAAVELKNPEWKQHLRRARGLDATAEDRLLALLNVGKTPVHLALKPDGGEIFVSNFEADTYSEVATSAAEVGGSYAAGDGPTRGLVANDNATLIVSNFFANNVSFYDITISRHLATVPVGTHPDAMVLSSNQFFLFVADSASGDVAVIRTKRQLSPPVPSLFTLIPVGIRPSSMVVKAFFAKN